MSQPLGSGYGAYVSQPQKVWVILLVIVVVVVWVGLTLPSPSSSAEPSNQTYNRGVERLNVVYRNSVSQYGITWTFDHDYVVGQFANGDYWVVGPVQIVNITPAAEHGKNGWMVNPVGFMQAYDDRTQLKTPSPIYNSSLQPTLPYLANPNSSIIKAISVDPTFVTCRPCLKTAAVLTVVGSTPPGNGKNIFRPPYFGIAKPMIATTSMQLDLLPSLVPPKTGSQLQPLSAVTNRFKRVQLDHVQPTWLGDNIHPADNMPNYGASIARDTGDAALRLMLNDPVQSKIPALIAYVQYGIDAYYTLLGGMSWPGDGGHDSGRKLPIVFASVLLDDPAMKSLTNEKSTTKSFGEDGLVYFSPHANGGNGQTLWGAECTEAQYWTKITTSQGPRDCRDPYGYVDGGSAEIGAAYQLCCTSKPWKSTALALHLMPALGLVWNNPYFLLYVDRWVNFGVWAEPDPCALESPPKLIDTCVPGLGRFPSKHGASKDSGFYGSAFADSMWAAYRNSPSAIACRALPSMATSSLLLQNWACEMMIRLGWRF